MYVRMCIQFVHNFCFRCVRVCFILFCLTVVGLFCLGFVLLSGVDHNSYLCVVVNILLIK